MIEQIKDYINPGKNPDLTPAHEFRRKNLPTLWLLPEQSSVLSALKQIKKKKQINHLLLIHSAVLLSEEKDRERQITFNRNQVEAVWGKDFNSLAVDFETEDGSIYHYDELISYLEEMLPVISMVARRQFCRALWIEIWC